MRIALQIFRIAISFLIGSSWSSSGQPAFPGATRLPILKTTMMIESKWRNRTNAFIGTGFLVGRPVVSNGQTNEVRFLVTNKHVVGTWSIAEPNMTQYFDELTISVYSVTNVGAKSYRPLTVRLTADNGTPLPLAVRIHNDPLVDVAILPFPETATPGANYTIFGESLLLPFKDAPNQIGVGDQVFALGYPLGIRSLHSNYPLAKSGYLASVPGEEMSVIMKSLNRLNVPVATVVAGKLFLIDGLLTPGNSGGPVVIPLGQFIYADNAGLNFRSQSSNRVLGIVSSGWTAAGLTVVYSADYIREVIDDYITSVEIWHEGTRWGIRSRALPATP